MKRYFKEEGIVLKKIKLREKHRLITFFSKNSGKINLFGFGTGAITSRRLSHLETGNYIKFSYQKKNDTCVLYETDIIWGFSKIKKSTYKLNTLFLLLFILNKILPENQVEKEVFNKTLIFLRDLNNKTELTVGHLNYYLEEILEILGFVDRTKIEGINFDSIDFVEGLINEKLNINFLE